MTRHPPICKGRVAWGGTPRSEFSVTRSTWSRALGMQCKLVPELRGPATLPPGDARDSAASQHSRVKHLPSDNSSVNTWPPRKGSKARPSLPH